MQASTLAACCLAALCVLAGCGGNGGAPPAATPPVNESGPATTPTTDGTPTAFGPNVADTERGAALLDVLRGRSIPVQSVETRNRTVQVRYEAANGSRAQTAFFLALAYGETVNDTWASAATWNASGMDAVAVADGTPVLRYRMPAYWGRQTATGGLNVTELGARVRNATATVDPTDPRELAGTTSFRSAARDAANGTVTEVERRGTTVFLSVETDTDDGALASELSRLTGTYGRQVADGWNSTALEVEVRRPDGDLYGWYRVEADTATAVAAGNGTVPGGVLEAVYLEDDALEPSP